MREAVRCRWRKAEERRNRRIREEREDILAVKEVFEENHRIYGCRRMRQALENRGKIMSEWRIRRIMRENGLKTTTDWYAYARNDHSAFPYQSKFMIDWLYDLGVR